MAPAWFRYSLEMFLNRYIRAYIYTSTELKKNKSKILREMVWALITKRISPFFYFHYGFYLKSQTITKIDNYITESLFYYKYLVALNQHWILLDDKNVFSQICKSEGLTIPSTVLRIKNGRILDHAGNEILCTSTFDTFLCSLRATELICKPALMSSGGEGIFKLRINVGHAYCEQTRFGFLEFMKLAHRDWIIEECLVNHSELRANKEEALNCIRVITAHPSGADPVAMYIVYKVATTSCLVDNAHSGGIYVGVNIDTGYLFSVGFTEKYEMYTQHPISGASFSGIRIPYFENALQLSIRAAKTFPSLKVIGWDIAITPSGPVIIEGNSFPGLALIQKAHQGAPKLIKFIKEEYAKI